MKFLKVVLYCLLGILFACGFTLLGVILVYVCENKTSNLNYKELTGGGIVNDSDIIGEETVPYVISTYLGDENTPKDVPQITLRADSTIVKVGDIVTFKAISSLSSDNADFERNRTFYYDFDGNGTWDLVTKQDEIKYTYINLYEEGVTPSVAVEYEGNFLQAKGVTIQVVDKRYLLNIKEEKIEGETVITMPMDIFEINKMEILSQLPVTGDIRLYIDWMFRDFEENFITFNKEKRAEKLNEIWNTIIEDGNEDKWLKNEEDFTQYFCNIFDYYEINYYTDKC